MLLRKIRLTNLAYNCNNEIYQKIIQHSHYFFSFVKIIR